MRKCCVPGCRTEWDPETSLSFHGIPRDPELRKLWIDAIGKEKPAATAAVCSNHFTMEDFEIHTKKRRLKKNAVPGYFLANWHERQPRKELAVPSICISKGNEKYLELPILTSVLSSKNNMQVPQSSQALTSSQEPTPVYREDSTSDVADTAAPDSDDNVSVKSEIEIEEEQNLQECSNTSFEMPRPFIFPKQETRSCFLEVSPMDIADSAENFPAPILKSMLTYNRTAPRDPKLRIPFLQRKVKILEQRLRRKNAKHENLKKLVNAVKVYTNSSEIENILSGNFRKLCAAYNNNGVCVNYTDEVIKFAITVHYYSPKAYEFIRKFMSLPTERMLKKYASTGTYIINIDK